MASPTDPVNPAAPEAVAWPGQSWALDGTDPAVPDFRLARRTARRAARVGDAGSGAADGAARPVPAGPARRAAGRLGAASCAPTAGRPGWTRGCWSPCRPTARRRSARGADGGSAPAAGPGGGGGGALPGGRGGAGGGGTDREGFRGRTARAPGWAWSSRASRCGCTTRSTSAGCTRRRPTGRVRGHGRAPPSRPRAGRRGRPVPASTGTRPSATGPARTRRPGKRGGRRGGGRWWTPTGPALRPLPPGTPTRPGPQGHRADRSGRPGRYGRGRTRTGGAPPDTAGTADNDNGDGDGDGAETAAGGGRTESSHEAADAGGPGEAGDAAEAGEAGEAGEARGPAGARRGGADEDDGRSGPAREKGAPAQQQATRP